MYQFDFQEITPHKQIKVESRKLRVESRETKTDYKKYFRIIILA